MIYKVF